MKQELTTIAVLMLVAVAASVTTRVTTALITKLFFA